MFSLPKLEFDFDMTGLSKKIRMAYGVFLRPGEKFYIINTAVDPDGVHYWKFVNYGTGPKSVGAGKPYLVFSIDDTLVYAKAVAGNPAVHMLERALPELRDFFKEALREIPAIGPRARPKDITFEWMDGVFLRTAEKFKQLLEELTPVIQEHYMDPHPIYGTPEPGLLKDSYVIVPRTSDQG